MMVSEEEKVGIRRFVKGQLRDESDLSTLTLGILKKRYLAHAGCESLSSEARKFMKQVVEEELSNMQKSDDSESEPEPEKPEKKRKREKEELESEDETKSTAKKTRSRQSGSSSDSEDEQSCKTGSQSKEQIRSQSKNKEAVEEESAEEEEESDSEKSKKPDRRVTGDDLSDDEMNGSEKSGSESPTPEERVKKKASTAKTRKIRSGGKKPPRSDEEGESHADSKSEKSDKISDGDSSASEKEENVEKRKDSDSDSSSLCSLEEEEKKGSQEKTKDEKKKNKTKKKDEKNRGPKDEDKAVVRLKRYIALCGVRRNYKKLLDGCRSVRSKVAVLKKELEDLGVRGNPSIEKCKKVRLKREEAQELADLDVDNIITTEGRPKRRGTSAIQGHQDAPSSYQRTLNSDSDSDQENDANKGRRKMSEWANLHGIISDDADTD